MALRRACAESKAAAPTHALVQFEEEDTISVVPLKRVSSPPREDLAKGVRCTVKWALGKLYLGVVLAIGKAFCSFCTLYHITCCLVGV